jgi:hypothetical protein
VAYDARRVLAELFAPTAGEWVGRMSPDQRFAWAERAAVMEFDGGLSRPAAEAEAAKAVSGAGWRLSA